MTEITDLDEMQTFLNAGGTKLLYVHAPECGFCEQTQSVLDHSRLTLSSLLDITAKIDARICEEFCMDQGVMGTPALVLMQNDEILSILNSSPTQELFLNWVTNAVFG